MVDNCIFCKIIRGEIPSTKVYENDSIMAFMDIMPAVKGHTLVIPKKHYETFIDIPSDEIESFMVFVQKTARAVVKATEAQGFKIESFNKPLAGQTVPHLHFHIIPRYENDHIQYHADANWWVPHTGIYKEGELQIYADSIIKLLE